MKASGKVLLHSGDVASWGNPTFDGWVVNREFAEQNPDFLIAFIKVLDQINGAYNANPAAWDAGAKEVQAIAAQTGAKPEDVAGTLSGYSFLASKDQASAGWLGGAVAANMLKTSKFLAEQKRIDSALDDYTTFVNAKFVEAASQ
jgi:taurine transport system substrate-binding protein